MEEPLLMIDHVSKQYVSAFEQGRCSLSLYNFRRLCTYLGVKTDEILFPEPLGSRAEKIDEINRSLFGLAEEELEIVAKGIDVIVEALDSYV